MSEQKIWVEKIPKNCWECPCFRDDIDFPCGLSDGIQDYFKDEIDGGKCPLHSIKAHDRELVRQVCMRILKIFDGNHIDYLCFDDLIDQIQKEFEK